MGGRPEILGWIHRLQRALHRLACELLEVPEADGRSSHYAAYEAIALWIDACTSLSKAMAWRLNTHYFIGTVHFHLTLLPKSRRWRATYLQSEVFMPSACSRGRRVPLTNRIALRCAILSPATTLLSLRLVVVSGLESYLRWFSES